MQDIENDMDDLFRRAAEEYPLQAGKSNWESIEKKISLLTATIEPQKPEGQKNNKKLFPFLLLTGILLLIGFALFNPDLNNYKTGKAFIQANQRAIPDNKISGKLPTTNNTVSGIRKSTAGLNSVSEKNKIPTANLPKNKNENVFPNSGSYQKTNSPDYQKKTNPDTIVDKKYFEKEKEELLSDNKNTGYKNHSSPKEKNVIPIEHKKTKAGIRPAKEKGLYAGIIAVIDHSKVKSTSFKEPGFSAGILIGYRVRSFFTETGITIGHKYYSSEGNLFNDQDASMPSGMIIDNLESRSKILEISLKAGYYFYKKKNTNLFIAGGTALYIMTREKNNYNVTMNGNPEKMVGLYEKNSLKIPAVLNISAGWEHDLTGLLKIRIEPVLKLPLQGIGVGRLPVTSAGIQIGITRRLK